MSFGKVAPAERGLDGPGWFVGTATWAAEARLGLLKPSGCSRASGRLHMATLARCPLEKGPTDVQ